MQQTIVYALQHNVTKRIYIGSTQRGQWRIHDHIRYLRQGKHKNELMQEDYNKYGEDYSFYQLDVIPTTYERYREYFWMNYFNTYDPEFGYNNKDQSKKKQVTITGFPKIDVSMWDKQGKYKLED